MSYFDNYPAEVWSYKNFIHYASGNSCLPRNPAKTWNYAYKQSLDEIERRYGHTDEKGRKASRLKSSFKASTSIWQKAASRWQCYLDFSQIDTTGRLHTALGFLEGTGDWLVRYYRALTHRPGFPRRAGQLFNY
ncbi:11568_t:CDS:1 [Paraglomus brasilianum]|uniref:11568_t:CDS:1 n=1 Tax=Paraglomus brasilianum TaxID=144538 RepID=A0A9N9DCW4_9GLOM|nr:11568_t:CDS:1 [Paraglomus brasilianum]